MPTKQSENLALLRKHLVKDSLASKLAAAYEHTPKPDDVPAALDAVLSARLQEVRNAIEHGKTKLG